MSYNPVVGSLSKLPRAATQGFHLPILKTAVTVVAGSFITSFLSKKIGGMIPGGLGSSGIGKVATTLLTAGIVGAAAKKVMPARANELFAGGVISGVTEGLNEFLPESITGALGMNGYDWGDELGQNWQMHGVNDFFDPRQAQHSFPARQPIGDFTSFPAIAHAAALSSHQPMGIGDFADPRQVGSAFQARQPIGGMADMAVSEEIEMTM